MSDEPFVMVDDPNNPPWGNERVCPNCGAGDLPLESATSTNGRITLTYINHCGMQWIRGPLGVNP